MNEEQQQRYDALEAEKQLLNPNNPDDRFRQTVIEQEQAKIKTQVAADDRLQRQAAEVAEIQLPEDYDARWGVEGANDEIRSLLRQVKEYQFGEHNDEMAKVQEESTNRIRTVEADKATLIDRVAQQDIVISELEERAQRVEEARRAAEVKAQIAEERQAEAETKRDNCFAALQEAEAERDKAVGQVKGLKGQIDELEGMLRTYRSRTAPGAIGGLVLTSTLKPVPEESTEEAERKRIEQINRGLSRLGHEPLPFPNKEVAAAAEETEEADEERFLPGEAAADGVVEGDAPVEVAGAAPELTLEGLNERVKALELCLFG